NCGVVMLAPLSRSAGRTVPRSRGRPRLPPDPPHANPVRAHAGLYHPAAMRIDELFTTSGPVFSFEFFPPRTPEGVETLFETVQALKPLAPSFVSVTYGAGGATRDGSGEIAIRVERDHGLDTMEHLCCLGETSL